MTPPPPVAEPEVNGADTVEPDGLGFICPECHERLESAVSLGLHKRNVHGIASDRAEKNKRQAANRKNRASGASNRGTELNRLRRQLKDGARGLALLPFMAKGSAVNLNDPRINELLEEKTDGFADSWVAVAEQNEWVRAALGQLLVGGVWLNAGIQTVTLAYCVAVFSNTIPLHPGAAMLLPEMRQFMFTPDPAANGGGTGGGAESA